MITQFRVQNFKALRDVTLDLTPIHVLIGPNDSGKTSILQAIAALSRSVDYSLEKAFMGAWEGRNLVRNGGNATVHLGASLVDARSTLDYALHCEFGFDGRSATIIEEVFEDEHGSMRRNEHSSKSLLFRLKRGTMARDSMSQATQDAANSWISALDGVQFHHFDPAMLALPVALNHQRGFRMDETGFGLAQCLDEIIGHDRAKFGELEKTLFKFFPQFEMIRLASQAAYSAPLERIGEPLLLGRADGKGIWFKRRGCEQDVPASQASDGTLLVLAYLAVLYLPKPPNFLLIEEPENGIHPARLSDVLKILRTVAEERGTTQVILTTHSPYVVSTFKPEEVTLCRMEEHGEVTVHRLDRSQLVRQQESLFTLGEIWTGEGDDALAASVNGAKP